MNSLDFTSLGQLKADAATTADVRNNPALKKAAEQFEAMFIQMMMKTMREASGSEGEDLMGNNATQTYQGLFDQEIAHSMAKRGGLGLADMMIKSVERNQGMPPSAADLLASRDTEQSRPKGLPIQRPEQALPLRQDVAAGLAITRDKVQTTINRDRLVVSTDSKLDRQKASATELSGQPGQSGQGR